MKAAVPHIAVHGLEPKTFGENAKPKLSKKAGQSFQKEAKVNA
jgi:hypothetical protein